MVWKYDKPQLKDMARNLRRDVTEAERKLWSKLRGKQINDLQFYRQRPIGRYIADFYCPKKSLVIEVDGGRHYEDDDAVRKDRQRTDYLKKQFGLRVLRFTNIEVLKNLEGVLMKIIEEIDKSTPTLLWKRRELIHPNPPLKKEGVANLPPSPLVRGGRVPPFFKGRLGGIYYKDWPFALIRDDCVVYVSEDKGLAPLLFCLKNHKRQMQGADIFDKVIGRAAALLLVYGGVKKVLTPIISRPALEYLEQNGVMVEHGKIVKNILNGAGTDLCPMEKLSAGKSGEELLCFYGV